MMHFVDIETNPYVDQSIEIMSYNRAGMGVSIKYDNSGISSGTRSWNKFLDGLPDPESEDPEDMDTLLVNHLSELTKFTIELDFQINQFFIQVVVMHQRVIP